ncbi:hypothetical protein A3K34_01145 [candidate division WWE3 bacterium RIFOXYC1_FULL_40_10]|uniref:FG-GAP repeat protein n=1 Tax=candidate division WWE3 bacterium RIFOXYA2_FULL_46_9 TaxID=1802636 RepID=A0A1F4W295_UNCKA|nr:MAG: hypothetical protein A3K58_01145 [candidate division WWE3 bacterium RIFOXYB1_FULL_40_22]OGC61475.1 MAG: hypothetical protein A3K37_01145 [candidate division WWE3 bacterium RIFOXYA1_FULL_40_11]OGC63408.1 MAG: hypothetical protein A2264_01625 [candidate division WWE3 bacterium RIFOXYA2_FULL_46_9]OGC64562.1 MAG: hypothetical protein A2326_03620 [candidate division WWE3 bacterium RIFOXYB2_FULL_41_6]OGC65858.1 MAG: hypothetical protein A3K34_01145 [candidate division WWE3 bacterium RIFOXYC1_
MPVIRYNLLFLITLLCILCPVAFATPSLTLKGTATDGTSNTPYASRVYFGDYNGDGYDDYATSNGQTGNGKVYIYFGGLLFDNTVDITITGEAASDFFGSQEDGISLVDLNGDGSDELIVGAPYNDAGGSNVGKIYIYTGGVLSSGTYAASVANTTLVGNLTDRRQLGRSVSYGDADNDGDMDLLIGSIAESQAVSKLHIFTNSSGVVDFSASWAILSLAGSTAYSVFSRAMAYDFNDDSFNDILVSDGWGYSYTGKDLNISFGDGTTAFGTTTSFPESSSASAYGRANSYDVSDINLDGKEDICASIYTGSSNRGSVFCWFGRETFLSSYAQSTADITLTGPNAGDYLGRGLTISDVNNDGKPDLLAGATQWGATKRGALYIYKGTGETFSSSPWLTYAKTSGTTSFGASVSTGDLDSDGWVDINVTTGGQWVGGSGASYINIFEIDHGNPTISVAGASSGSEMEGEAISGDPGYTVKGVEWSTSANLSGTWTACTPKDGTFDESTEEFSCNVSSFEDGESEIYLRSYDQNDVYMPERLIMHKDFTLDKESPGESDQLVGLSKDNLVQLGSKTLKSDDRELTLYFDVKDSTTEVKYLMLSQKDDFKGAKWKAYDGDIKLSFDHDGKKNLFIRFKDDAGNVSDTFKQTLKITTKSQDDDSEPIAPTLVSPTPPAPLENQIIASNKIEIEEVKPLVLQSQANKSDEPKIRVNKTLWQTVLGWLGIEY